MKLRNVRCGRPPRQEIPPEAIAAPDLAKQIPRWLAWLKNERRCSTHTLAAYRGDLWAFLVFQGSQRGGLPAPAVFLLSVVHAGAERRTVRERSAPAAHCSSYASILPNRLR